MEFENFAQQIREGNEQLFETFLLKALQKNIIALRSLINSEEERSNIVLDAIYKFRKDFIDDQRRVLKGNPPNPMGYIFQMAKNRWFVIQQKKKKEREELVLFKKTIATHEDPYDRSEEERQLEKDRDKQVLKKALAVLKEKCRNLITKHHFDNIALKDLWKELGYPSYGACRVKHHDCKKSLLKLFMKLK